MRKLLMMMLVLSINVGAVEIKDLFEVYNYKDTNEKLCNTKTDNKIELKTRYVKDDGSYTKIYVKQRTEIKTYYSKDMKIIKRDIKIYENDIHIDSYIHIEKQFENDIEIKEAVEFFECLNIQRNYSKLFVMYGKSGKYTISINYKKNTFEMMSY